LLALATNFVNYANATGLGANSEVTGSNQVQLGGPGTTAFAFGAVQNRSDLRDKADVRDTVLGLDFIAALRPVDFRWDYREDYRPPMPEAPAAGASDSEREDYETALRQWAEASALGKLATDGSRKRSRYHHGLIAQEVAEVIAETGIDFGGYQDHALAGGDDVRSLGYDEFIAPLIKAVQELAARNDALAERCEAIAAQSASLSTENAAIRTRLAALESPSSS
jgi:trimeric autotransporter adhesin